MTPAEFLDKYEASEFAWQDDAVVIVQMREFAATLPQEASDQAKPKFDEAEFAEMVKRGTAAWGDVPDDWLERHRGNVVSDQAKDAAIGYVRETELAKLADTRVAGVGMMIHKDGGAGLVPVFLAAAMAAQEVKKG